MSPLRLALRPARITAVVAVDLQLGIGVEGGLPPWNLRDDLRRFRARTLERPVLMGARTHRSIGRALPRRRNLVVSRRPDLTLDGCEVFGSLEAAVAAAADAEELMVIGGGAVYAALAPHLDALHLTIVHHAFDTDTHLRDVPAGCWEVEAADSWPRDDANDWPCTVLELRRWTRASRGALAPGDLASLVHARPGDRF